MNSARDRMLAAVRHGLGRGPLSAAAQREVDARRPEPGTASLRPRISAADPAKQFRRGLELLSGSLAELEDEHSIPAAVAAYLKRERITGPLAIAPALRELDWEQAVLAGPAACASAQQELDLDGVDKSPRFGRAAGDEIAGISRAFCGIVETGSLVLLSGPDNPTTINFLPEHHLVVLNRDDLLLHIEDVWDRMRARGGDWPRTVNIITGPSRTADIEQTIQLGAHGPRRLHVLLVE